MQTCIWTTQDPTRESTAMTQRPSAGGWGTCRRKSQMTAGPDEGSPPPWGGKQELVCLLLFRQRPTATWDSWVHSKIIPELMWGYRHPGIWNWNWESFSHRDTMISGLQTTHLGTFQSHGSLSRDRQALHTPGYNIQRQKPEVFRVLGSSCSCPWVLETAILKILPPSSHYHL